MIPAIASSIEILKSAATHAGPQLGSVIFLSSAVVTSDPRRLQNNDRVGSHQLSLTEAERQGLKPQLAAARFYQASKTMAEKAVWRWKDEYQVRWQSGSPLCR